MKNTIVLATKQDFNPFTLALKARCQAEGEVLVRMRNGDYCKVVHKPAKPEAFEDEAFHKADHSAYWEPSGHSVTNSQFDLVEFEATGAAPAPTCSAPASQRYGDMQLETAPRVRATIVRGHITRFDKRESWSADLVALPPGTVPEDADAVCHYRKGPDGRFYEFYGWTPSTANEPIYVLRADVLPTPVLKGDERFKHACWLTLQFPVGRYLMSNAHGRWDGAEKAHRHEELCTFYVAAIRGVDAEDVRRDFEEDYKSVHRQTQALTDHLDEVIGFPLESDPDYEILAPKFFERFHVLALEALLSAE